MRFKGILKKWNDDRGFGFIDPIQGGHEVFVHITAFSTRRGRPQVNELLWFEVELGPEGKQRAKNVELVQRIHPRDKVFDEPSAPRGTATLIALPPSSLFCTSYSASPGSRQLSWRSSISQPASPRSLPIPATSQPPSKVPGELPRTRCTCWRLPGAGLAPCLLSSACATNQRNPSFGLSSGSLSL